MARDFYAELAADYDRMIRWEGRLKNERPLFETIWERYGVRSVLDASCGTGHHLVLFASMGLAVTGTDASEDMIHLARKTTEKAGLFMEDAIFHSAWADLTDKLPHVFDAVLCIGNSLPYVMGEEELQRSLSGLWSRVRKSGILLIQFKNFEKLYRNRQRMLPLVSRDEPHQSVALRIYDYYRDHIDFNVILLDREADEWKVRHHVTPLKPYRSDEIASPLEEMGATVSIHGSLGLEPFDPVVSDDLVVLAQRV